MNFLWKRSQILAPWGRSWAQDEISRAARAAVCRENSKWWTKIHTRLTRVSRMERDIQPFFWFITFFGFIEDKVIWQRRTIAQKCLEILLLLYNLNTLASDQKTFLFLRTFFDQLSIQKATFDCFLSNFLRNYEQLFGKSGTTGGNRWYVARVFQIW